MKTVQVELPDKLATEIDKLVQSGWFHNEQELMRYALTEFVRHNLLELTRKQQLEDIEWAISRRKETASPDA
ncbi:MAG: ribbon-helix-helix domain-containing protein [Candidatus Poribacteria bacterium]|nr:ribbon-helix-helix domain-containing protein [Candidatus Poribacteria bacterium]